jgi:hypothetical protein
VEDYYARCMLAVLDGVYSGEVGSHPAAPSYVRVFRGYGDAAPAQGESARGRGRVPRTLLQGRREEDDETRRWRKRVEWLRDPAEVGGLKEQMWILFHVLFFLHCEKREEIRGVQKAERKGVVKSLFCWRV